MIIFIRIFVILREIFRQVSKGGYFYNKLVMTI